MKKVLFLLFLLPAISFAKEVAIINTRDVLENSTALIKLKEALQTEKDQFQQKFEVREKSLAQTKDLLETKQNQILKRQNDGSVSKEQLEKEVQDLQKQASAFQENVAAFQKEVKDAEDKLQNKLIDSMNVAYKELQKVVKQMLQEPAYSKYSLVLTTDSVVYFDVQDEITAEALKRLNKSFPKFK